MFGIFLQGRGGMTWLGNEPTLEDAKQVGDAYRQRETDDVDFVIIMKVEALIDVDGEREV